MNDKCEVDVVNQMEARLMAVEERSQRHEQELVSKVSLLEQKVANQVDEGKVQQTAFSSHNIETGGLQQSVVDTITKKTEHEKDVEILILTNNSQSSSWSIA